MEFSFYYAEVIWCWWEGNVRKTAQEAIVLSAQSYAEAARMIEEKDYSKPEPPVEDTVKEIPWNPNKTPFPYDAPLGTVIICDNSSTSAKQEENATYSQNWEGGDP